MIAVIFEVEAADSESYLRIAAELRPLLDSIDGFISIERFQSLNSDKILSLSFWRDEAAIAQWRNLEQHRSAQRIGRDGVFANYRLRIAHVLRDYGMHERAEAPPDSNALHKQRPFSRFGRRDAAPIASCCSPPCASWRRASSLASS